MESDDEFEYAQYADQVSVDPALQQGLPELQLLFAWDIYCQFAQIVSVHTDLHVVSNMSCNKSQHITDYTGAKKQ